MTEPEPADDRKPEVYCCCGRPYSRHGAFHGINTMTCPGFTPRPPDPPPGSDAAIRQCDHGFRADSCPDCFGPHRYVR